MHNLIKVARKALQSVYPDRENKRFFASISKAEAEQAFNVVFPGTSNEAYRAILMDTFENGIMKVSERKVSRSLLSVGLFYCCVIHMQGFGARRTDYVAIFC